MWRLIWIVLFSISLTLSAQEKFYNKPVKIPIFLTGSFAELRNNHFHSGIDIRTEGKIGLPVYSTANGYVSRIVVSPTGFGNALYVDHKNGTTSVYGHLSRFAEPIAQYIKTIQYKNESFNIDIPVPPGKFNVSNSEVIALSGNTGGSGGPHLHFEIRDTKTQDPINPLNYDFNINDNISPKILGLKIYPLNQQSYVNYSAKTKNIKTYFYDGNYHLKNAVVVPVYGEIGFGIETTDYLNGNQSRCGINFLQLKVDGNEIFSFELNRFSFSQTRYLNSHIDFEAYMKTKKRYQKTWREQGNKLNIYKIKNGSGAFLATDEKKHKVEITIKDSNENQSILEFFVKSTFKNLPENQQKGYQEFYYNSTNYFEAPGIKLDCPIGAFYTDFDYEYSLSPAENDSTLYSGIHRIHYNTTPIHNSITLSIKPDRLPDKLIKKALIVTVDEKTNSRRANGGNFKNGFVSTMVRSFGSFAIAVDTIPPTIRPLSIKNKKTITEQNRIRFKISDSLSGIKSYVGTIDNKWVLFEYDSKNSLITYNFDKERMEFNKKHKIILTVSDNKNNKTFYEGSFFK